MDAGLRDRINGPDGQNITLRRTVSGTNTDVVCRAFVRGYQPQQLVGGIIQGDVSVIIGVDEINAASWPAPPRQGDRVNLGNSWNPTVQFAEPVRYNGAVVRYNLQVRG